MTSIFKQQICFLLIAGTAASIPVSANSDAEHQQTKGFGIGAVVGGLIAGPPGLVIGSVIGSGLGQQQHQSQTITEYQQELQQQEQQLASLHSELQQLRLAQQMKTVNLQQQETLQSQIKNMHFSVFFRTAESEITPVFSNMIDQLTTLTLKHKNIKIYIDAYADPRGDDQYNLRLSKARAKSIENILIESGITAERITLRAHGEFNRMNEPDTSDNHALQRRVDIQLTFASEV